MLVKTATSSHILYNTKLAEVGKWSLVIQDGWCLNMHYQHTSSIYRVVLGTKSINDYDINELSEQALMFDEQQKTVLLAE